MKKDLKGNNLMMMTLISKAVKIKIENERGTIGVSEKKKNCKKYFLTLLENKCVE